MGLGKTVQTIAFLSAVLGKTAGPSDTLRRFPLSPTDCKQALLVVPVSTLGNWRRELRTWGCFRVALGHGKEFAASIAQVQAREVEILLTTYGMVRDHGKDIQAHPWEVTVWDEAHTIKNPRTRLSKAADAVACTRRFCMTGTPMSNDHTELWALFNFVSSDRVGEKKDFKKFYGDVLKRGMRHNATQHQLRQRVKRQITLQALIQKWMLQRFKTIIAHQMPKKIDQIILCKLAPAQASRGRKGGEWIIPREAGVWRDGFGWREDTGRGKGGRGCMMGAPLRGIRFVDPPPMSVACFPPLLPPCAFSSRLSPTPAIAEASPVCRYPLRHG
jgi:SNF2 family DNA or RNA helicase